MYYMDMELRLNIYKEDAPQEIEKSYVSQDFELMTGTCEDILEIIGIERVVELMGDANKLGEYLLKKVILQYNDFKPFVFKAFSGLTEDEFARTRMAEVGQTLVSIVIYTIQQLFSILTPASNDGKKRKNP